MFQDIQAMDAKNNKNTNLQEGFSLVELMISLVAGLIVVGGVTSVYLSTIQSSATTLKQSKLNQELSALMAVMSNDIRRAGIWQGNSVDYEKPQDNPFSESGNTKLTVVNQTSGVTINPFSTTTWPGTSNGNCILYTYDRTSPGATGTLDDTDILGFKYITTNLWGAVQMRTAGVPAGTNNDLCTTGSWDNLTDPEIINITELTFDLIDSACINTAEPNGIDDDGDSTTDEDQEKDCYTVPPSSGDITTETRQVDITVIGSLISDPFITLKINQTIRVRNDHVEEW